MMAASFLRRMRRDASGSATVEFALALPVLILFFCGIAASTLALFVQNSVKDAVGVGARYATLSPTPTAAEVIAKVKAVSQTDLTGSSSTVTVSAGTDSAGRTYFTISASKAYQFPIYPFAGRTVTLSATKRAYTG